MKNKSSMWFPILLATCVGAAAAVGIMMLANPANQHESDVHDHEEENVGHAGDSKALRLTPEQMNEFGIEVGPAGPGTLQIQLNLTGEVVLNADRLAHVVPRVSGVVRSVTKSLGDHVHTGEVMAVLDSRELADAKSEYLGAGERVTLAKATFKREEILWEKKITSGEAYLAAKQALAEAKIASRSAEQKLHALGLSEKEIEALPKESDENFTRFEVRAPFDGTVIEKHIAIGEALKDDADAFLVADLGSVWVNLSVYQKDLAVVRKGQSATIVCDPAGEKASGEISYVRPVVGEDTRTALARIVLENKDGRWKPGLFITACVSIEEIPVPIAVPKTALQMMEGKPVVFVQDEDGFEPREVKLGRSTVTLMEIVSGLKAGDTIVTKGGFVIKSELQKSSFGDGHNH